MLNCVFLVLVVPHLIYIALFKTFLDQEKFEFAFAAVVNMLVNLKFAVLFAFDVRSISPLAAFSLYSKYRSCSTFAFIYRSLI